MHEAWLKSMLVLSIKIAAVLSEVQFIVSAPKIDLNSYQLFPVPCLFNIKCQAEKSRVAIRRPAKMHTILIFRKPNQIKLQFSPSFSHVEFRKEGGFLRDPKMVQIGNNSHEKRSVFQEINKCQKIQKQTRCQGVNPPPKREEQNTFRNEF